MIGVDLSWIIFPVAGVCLFLLMISFIRGLQRKKLEKILSRFSRESIVRISSNASFFGLGSAGGKQIRGNGVLILTKDQLFFEMLLPSKIIQIPLNRIRAIETPRSHAGKAVAWKLLKIVYQAEDGSEDSAAWAVRDLEGWMEMIRIQQG